MVSVRGGQHWISGYIRRVTQLGLCQEPVRVDVKRHYVNVGADDFGARAAADVMVMQGECEVRMKLVHFDPFVLACCVSDSMGGTPLVGPPLIPLAGAPDFRGVYKMGKIQQPTGKLLGNGLPRFASGNYYVGLNLTGGDNCNAYDWRFFYSYLAEQPVIHKVGTEANTAELHWRVIRYAPFWHKVKKDGSKVTSIGDVGFEEGDPPLDVNVNNNNAPGWTDVVRNFPLADGQRENYVLIKEVASDPNTYALPLWDHRTDDNVSDGVYE